MVTCNFCTMPLKKNMLYYIIRRLLAPSIKLVQQHRPVPTSYFRSFSTRTHTKYNFRFSFFRLRCSVIIPRDKSLYLIISLITVLGEYLLKNQFSEFKMTSKHTTYYYVFVCKKFVLDKCLIRRIYYFESGQFCGSTNP